MSAPTPSEPPKLYSPRLLALSVELANFPLDPASRFVAQTRSRTCGSTARVGLDCDEGGFVRTVGMQISACAVGQSSAAIMAGGIIGKSLDDVAGVLEEIEDWLEGDGHLPIWRDFDALAGVHGRRGRYGALLLPWKAATEALSSRIAAG